MTRSTTIRQYTHYCPHCDTVTMSDGGCRCGKNALAPIAELYGQLNAGPVHSVLRDLHKHDNGEFPFTHSFDDPAIERAFDCATIHLDLLQGDYFRRQYEIADARGLL